MAEEHNNRAVMRGVSLYPAHIDIIEETAKELHLPGDKTFSPALQFIIADWKQLRKERNGKSERVLA